MSSPRVSFDADDFRSSAFSIEEWSDERVAFSIERDDVELGRTAWVAAILLGGATLLLGLLAVVEFQQGGIGGLLCPGGLWLLVAGMCAWIGLRVVSQSAPTSIVITEDTVEISRTLPWGRRTSSYPTEPDMVVEWLVEQPDTDTGDFEFAQEPSRHLELIGSHWRVPFGYGLHEDKQRILLRMLREHCGGILKDVCPDCDNDLWASDVTRETGRQHCRQCDWTSRGRQPVTIRSRTGSMLLPPQPRGLICVEQATPEELVVTWGSNWQSWPVLLMMLLTTGVCLFCLISGLLIPQINNPQGAVNVIGALWVSVIAISMPIVVVMYWHRHYRQRITLTAHQSRRDVEIERSVGGIPITQRISFEQGGYITDGRQMHPLLPLLNDRAKDVSGLPGEIVFSGTLQPMPVRMGQRLNPLERHWLTVVLNRFFGLPNFAMPDGKPFPDHCPECGEPLLPSRIDTSTGIIHCRKFTSCPWTSGLAAYPHLLDGVKQSQQLWNDLSGKWKTRLQQWRTPFRKEE